MTRQFQEIKFINNIVRPKKESECCNIKIKKDEEMTVVKGYKLQKCWECLCFLCPGQAGQISWYGMRLIGKMIQIVPMCIKNNIV